MKKLMLQTILLTLFCSCLYNSKPTENGNSNVQQTPSVNVASIFENYYNDRMRLYPFEATQNGVMDYNDKFPIDISDSYRDTLRAFYQKYQAEIAQLKPEKLSETDRISYEILKWETDIALEGLQHPDNLMPINQFWGRALDLGQLGSGDGAQPFKTAADYDNWLKRIAQFPAWADTAIANMRRGMARGWVLPNALVIKVLPQLEPMAQTPTDKHLFYQPIFKLVQNKVIDKEEKARLSDAYSRMVRDVVRPTYRKLYLFLEDEYAPVARKSAGISAVEGGKEYYAYLAKLWTTTNLTPDEIFDIGQKEVARIRAEMEAVKNQVGFKGDLNAFFKHVTEGSPKLRPFKKTEQVIANFNAIHEKMKPSLAKQFDLVPKTAFEVRRTEAFREASASAEYAQGNPETGRAGTFYVPLPDVSQYNIFQDEALFLHEAIPGHHYQIMLQAENQSLPKFRKFLWYGAYGEGWALYTEGLGKELGLYDDPYQYFGRLGNEMHRAIRLVVDVGMHTKGWSREQAIKYDLDNEADSEANIIAEIERYMAIPGQALSYKVGEIRILALKKKAQDALGAKFDIKKWHNEVLIDGCVPLALLEKKNENFIQKIKN